MESMASALSRVPCAQAHHRERPAGLAREAILSLGKVTATESIQAHRPSTVLRGVGDWRVGLRSTRCERALFQGASVSVDDNGCSRFGELGLGHASQWGHWLLDSADSAGALPQGAARCSQPRASATTHRGSVAGESSRVRGTKTTRTCPCLVSAAEIGRRRRGPKKHLAPMRGVAGGRKPRRIAGSCGVGLTKAMAKSPGELLGRSGRPQGRRRFHPRSSRSKAPLATEEAIPSRESRREWPRPSRTPTTRRAHVG
jgi:hypothetical protein